MKSINQSAFVRFFTKFPRLLLAGLMFTIPLAAFTAIFVLISYLTGFNNIIVWGLGIIFASPFYSGLVMIIRKYAVEKLDVNVFSTFFEAVKENFKKFLFHGFVMYLIAACTLFSLLYYYTLSKDDVVYGSVLTLYMMFSILLIIMMFYVPVMTVTYELRLRDIYKNSFLLIFGKIVRNLLALVLLALITAAAFLALMFAQGFMFITAVILTAVLYPLISTYIIISIISKGLQDTVGEFVGIEAQNEERETTEAELERERLALESADSNSDYVFVNGRMIKKSPDKDEKKSAD